MITITNIRNINYADYDEVWAVVRSLKNPGRMKQVVELSPSWVLFKKYLALRESGRWDEESFRNVYIPIFLKEMQNAEARKKVADLIALERQGKKICLACFCPNEALCHRSIIAGILQNARIQIYGIHADYSHYGRMQCAIL